MGLKEIGESISRMLYRGIGRASGQVQSNRSLPADILEDETSYLVVFDAPGVESDDVEVRYIEGNVRIRLERLRQFRDRYEMRFPGRGMTLGGEAELPADAIVDPDAGTATVTEAGTLTVEIPKDPSLEGTATAEATETSGDSAN